MTKKHLCSTTATAKLLLVFVSVFTVFRLWIEHSSSDDIFNLPTVRYTTRNNQERETAKHAIRRVDTVAPQKESQTILLTEQYPNRTTQKEDKSVLRHTSTSSDKPSIAVEDDKEDDSLLSVHRHGDRKTETNNAISKRTRSTAIEMPHSELKTISPRQRSMEEFYLNRYNGMLNMRNNVPVRNIVEELIDSRRIASATREAFLPRFGMMFQFGSIELAQELFHAHQNCAQISRFTKSEHFSRKEAVYGNSRTQSGMNVTLLSFSAMDQHSHASFIINAELSERLGLELFPKILYHCAKPKRGKYIVATESVVGFADSIGTNITWSEFENKTLEMLELMDRVDAAGYVLRRVRELPDIVFRQDGKCLLVQAAQELMVAPALMSGKTSWMVETILANQLKLDKPQRAMASRYVAHDGLQTHTVDVFMRAIELKRIFKHLNIVGGPLKFARCWKDVLDRVVTSLVSPHAKEVRWLMQNFRKCAQLPTMREATAPRAWHSHDFIPFHFPPEQWQPSLELLNPVASTEHATENPRLALITKIWNTYTETDTFRPQQSKDRTRIRKKKVLNFQASGEELPEVCKTFENSTHVHHSRICSSPPSAFIQPEGLFGSAGSRTQAISLFQRHEDCDRVQALLDLARSRGGTGNRHVPQVDSEKHAYKRIIASLDHVDASIAPLGPSVTLLEILSPGTFDYTVHNNALVHELEGGVSRLVPQVYAHCRSTRVDGRDNVKVVALETIPFPEDLNNSFPETLDECVMRASEFLSLSDKLDQVGLLFTDVKPGQTMIREDGTHVLVDTDSVALSPVVIPSANLEALRKHLKKKFRSITYINALGLVGSSFPGMIINIRATIMQIPFLLDNLGFRWEHCPGYYDRGFDACYREVMDWTVVAGDDWPDFGQIKNALNDCLKSSSFQQTKRVKKPWHDAGYVSPAFTHDSLAND